MTDSISQSDKDFLRELQSLGACTISQLCESQGVTTTAIRQRINRLLAAGLIEKETVKAERGRPFYQYVVTANGKKLLGNNYAELATVLWSQLGELEDDSLKLFIVKQVQAALTQKYGKNVNAVSPEERLYQLEQTLKQNGYSVDAEMETGRLVLMERSCPYHDLAVNDRSICDLEQQVFGNILGVQLELTQRCVEGHTCCRFEEVKKD